MTKIEATLFRGQNVAHAVTKFNIDDDCIHIKLAPWEERDEEMVPNHSAEVIAKFGNAKILTSDTYGDGGNDIKLPWNIIGFDSDELSSGRWSFCLHTDCIEYCFESDWPETEFVPKK